MIWSDIATWVGPTTARNAGSMAHPPQGLVLHIASGFYDGTISWQRRSSGSDRTSSHFIVGRDGRCAQMVDTADGSWAQRSGNNTWLSIELEGFAPDDGLHASHPGWEAATAQQVEVCARLLAKAHTVFGVPLQLATSPSGRGLGHHSMGAESGVDWGHSMCPGAAIKSQKPAILARAIAITSGDDMLTTDELALLRDTYAWARAACTGRDSAGKVFTDPYDGAPVHGVRALGELLDRPQVDVAAVAAAVVAALPPSASVDVAALVGPLADALVQHLPSHITLTGTLTGTLGQ